MKSPKIAIVGCGWVGLPLAISFIKNSIQVIGTTTSIEKVEVLNNLGIEGYNWSLSNFSSDENLFFLRNVDVLILNIPPGKSGDSISYSNALLDFCKFLPNHTKVVFISSTSVYPDSLKDASEDYVWSSEDLVKETVQAEIVLTEFLKSRLTILRFAGLIGPNRHPVSSLSKKINIPNGNSPINLIHLEDCIGLIKKIIEEEFWGEIVNGCFPIHVSREVYYSRTAEYFGLQVPHFLFNPIVSKTVSSKKSIEKLNYSYQNPIIEYT